MDVSALAVTLNALALLGVVWRGSSIVTTLTEHMKYQARHDIEQEEESRELRESRDQHAQLLARVVERLDQMDRRQDRFDRRLEGFSRGAT